MSSTSVADRASGWGDLLRGANLVRSVALSGSAALHAINLYLSTTILPSVVTDIGGVDYYAWNTSVFVVASIVAAALTSRALGRLGARGAYGMGAAIFALGAVLCAVAPSMAVMLVGRTVQGFGGGFLVALPYPMIRRVFPERLWPRAMALISSMWGIATLLGPAVGGVFAEFGVWRAAFWSLVPVTGLFTLMALMVLPGGAEGEEAGGLPSVQLLLLTAAVLAASVGSVGTGLVWNGGGVLVAGLLLFALVRIETGTTTQRLLPRGAFRSTSPLSALYALSSLLAITVTCTEIFVPLFLQVLHKRSPLEAGYIAAVMSAGWSLASVTGSGLQGRRLIRAFRASPLLSLASLATLAVIMPRAGDGSWAELAPIGLALIIGGFAVGLAYPHLATRVLIVAPDDEQEIAASSIMTVQLCATALGAALAGLIVNLAGLGEAGALASGGLAGAELEVARAARWLFVVLLAAPAVCLRLIWGRAREYAS